MTNKRALFEVFMDRMTVSQEAGMPFEAAWYAYAILEDRLVSLLRNSGGENDHKGKPIRMMGNKIKELRDRTSNDQLLAAYFPEHDVEDKKQTALWKWKEDRDELMHGMASGELTLEQIDGLVQRVATEGASLARDYANAATLLKKHRSKVPIPPKG
ncbi:hypothetical protein [Aurantiacibacter gilvus]|uniref:Uncharacterized protein n=1 Tax=Aurantiacibacter gilvus TaxID=3139141 RepID=A0ABU9I9J5_9SPHN